MVPTATVFDELTLALLAVAFAAAVAASSHAARARLRQVPVAGGARMPKGPKR